MHVIVITEVMRAAVQYTQHRTQQKQDALTASLHHIQQAAAAEKDQAQMVLLMKLASAAEDLQNRKMDLVIETFRETNKLIANHHAALLEERKELNSRRDDGSEAQQIRNQQRRGEIGLELFDLMKAHAVVAMQANRMAQQIGSAIRLPTTPLLT